MPRVYGNTPGASTAAVERVEYTGSRGKPLSVVGTLYSSRAQSIFEPGAYSQVMKSAHAGMGPSGADFGALVGELDKFKVGGKRKGELVDAFGPMKSDIVTK